MLEERTRFTLIWAPEGRNLQLLAREVRKLCGWLMT